MKKTVCFCVLFLSFQAAVSGINPYRKVIKTGEDIDLSCVSDHPVHWCYPSIYETPDIQSLPQERLYISPVKINFSAGLNYYKTDINIKGASYEYTGYYHCVRNDSDLPCNRVLESTENSTYMYVQDSSKLMVAQSYVGMKVYQNENAVLPCIPTSPYVNIHLYKDGELLKPGKLPDSETTVTFDRTVGFTLQPFTVSQSGLYTCVAIAKVGLQGTFSEELPISVMAEISDRPKYLMPPTIKMGSKVVKEVLVVKTGEKLKFDCYSLQRTPDFDVTWSFPYSREISLGFENCTKPRPTCKRGTLTIYHVTNSTAGIYTCETKSPNLKRVRTSFEIRIDNSVPVNSGYVLEAPYIQKYFVTIIFPLLLSHYSKFNI